MYIIIYGLLGHSSAEYSTNLIPQPRDGVSRQLIEAFGPFFCLDLWWTSAHALTKSTASGGERGATKVLFKKIPLFFDQQDGSEIS